MKTSAPRCPPQAPPSAQTMTRAAWRRRPHSRARAGPLKSLPRSSLWQCDTGMESLPLTPSIYSLILSNAISKQTVEAAAAPMLFYWGLWGTGGKGLFVQVFSKGRTEPRRPAPARSGDRVLGQRRLHTEPSGPLEQRTRISREKLGNSSSYSLGTRT